MKDYFKFYINGKWTTPLSLTTLDIINPATEEAFATISIGNRDDVNKAIAAAKDAFTRFSKTSTAERIELLECIHSEYLKRHDEIAAAISTEMGAPLSFSKSAQAATGLAHINNTIATLRSYSWLDLKGAYIVRKEPIGVCGLITPWNWPANQVFCKVAPALAAGCTMVLKPSEIAPISAIIIAELLHDAGTPKGVFNLINGDGATVGTAMSAHPDIQMMSFTGSTPAGIAVAKASADTVKRVTQELGGKSANIILEDADLTTAVSSGVNLLLSNAGQSCNAPSRMLVPSAHHTQALEIAKQTAETALVGDPRLEQTTIGPVASESQFKKIQALIQQGIDEGATLVTGGLGKPEGLDKGYFVKPTVFGDVNNAMSIAREEIFGPVLTILPYTGEQEAIDIANDSEYGLSGYVQSGSLKHALQVATQLRCGNVHINGNGPDLNAPFGGYKQSGNGREWGEYGMDEFLEIKAIFCSQL